MKVYSKITISRSSKCRFQELTGRFLVHSFGLERQIYSQAIAEVQN